ncbi:hypothetical protein J0H58_02455 [bacterium]|nr:hypothetical protein [bacterium]
MGRKVSILALAVATFAAAGGCRHRCGGWFTSNTRSDAPCQLVGSAPACDGVPVGGSFPAGVPGTVIPGGGFPPGGGLPPGGGGATELPLPQPSGDLIPRQGVPFAPPGPAPGDMGANVLPGPKGGVPVGRP